MTPKHHPTEEALLEYAGGASAESAALVYACHASLCAPCARRLSELEAVGGALLDGGAEQGLAADALARALASLDVPAANGGADGEASGGADGGADDAPPAAPEFLAPYRLPRPLARALARLPRAPKWHLALPGVRTIDLAPSDRETRVRLIAFKPGVTIPPHDHGGTEHVLVFTGAIEETGRRFARGDLATRERGEQHEQHIAAGELCVALVVNEGPLVPLTLRGRLLLALSRD